MGLAKRRIFWRLARNLYAASIAGPAAVLTAAELLSPSYLITVARAQAKDPVTDITARQVIQLLFKSTRPGDVDLSGRDLSSMDLSKLDFKSANLNNANLFGVDLSGARLEGANLSGASLDRSVLTRTDFSGANLTGVSFMRPSVFSTLQYDRREAPIFDGAVLKGMRFTGIFDGASFKNADLTYARMGPHDTRMDISSFPHNFFRGCNFSNAKVIDADLYEASLVMSNFSGADLRGTSFVRADFSRADLTNADLTGADVTEANFEGAILTGVVGLETARGLALAVNLDRAIR
jgi:uncharacterized protein YjbI with pentapeptide repeats